jgi:tetratricopeptide (TPR) repeat protein
MWHFVAKANDMNKQVLLLITLIICSPISRGQSISELNQKVNDCASKKDYKCAIDATKKLIKLEGSSLNLASYYFNLATFQRHLNYHKKALKSYNSAIKAYPNFLVAFRERAALLNFLGKPNGALKDLNMALTIDSIDVTTLLDRASFYNATEKLDLAAKDLAVSYTHLTLPTTPYV